MRTATLTARMPDDWRCPNCNCAEATREDPYPAEPDTDHPKFNGGWNCDNCGYIDEEPDDIPLADYDH